MTRQGTTGLVQINSKPYRVKNYVVDELESLAPAYRVGSPSYSDRQGEETAAQATWHMGMGRGEIRDPSERGRYHYSQNCDARIRGQIILGPLISSTTFATNAEGKAQFISYNGSWYAIGSRYVHVLSGTTWSVSKDMGASALAGKGCATVFGGNLYVADGNANLLKFTGAAWSTAATFTNPSLCAAVGTSIWVVSNSNQLQSSTDGTTFATAISVGESVSSATALVDYNGFPHIVKPDGLFFYDGQNLWNVYPELAFRKNSSNGKGSRVARGTLYMPVGSAVVGYSADLIVPDVLHSVSDRASGVETRGSFVEFWPDSDYLWAAFNSQGGNYYITAYDFNPDPGAGWHQVVKTGTSIISAIGIFNGSVYYSEGTAIKTFLLAQSSVNPYADSNYAYCSTGDIYLSQEADDYDDVQKSYVSLSLDTAGCSSTKTVVVKYSVDGAAELTLSTITTNGSHELFFPATTYGKRISIHLTLTTDNSAFTPQVFPVARRYKRRFPQVRRWTMDVEAARKSMPNIGQSADVQYTNLLAARNSIDGVPFIDVGGSIFTAYVEFVGDKPDDRQTPDAEEKSIHVVLIEKRTATSQTQTPTGYGAAVYS